MSETRPKLARPAAGFVVIGGLVVALVLILVAAYHGSGAATSSECGAARTLLRRTEGDVGAIQRAVTLNRPPTLAQATALQHDDDDVNNLINGAQHSDATFDGQILPLADQLGRVVTDLSGSTALKSDLANLAKAATAAGRYCGLSS